MGVSDPEQSLGMLLWLLAPVAISLLLRAFGGDGWRDLGLRPELRKNLDWYLLSVLVYPVCIAVFLGISSFFFDAVWFPSIDAYGVAALVQLVAIQLVANFVKNIAEEFVWRGYFTPKFRLLGLPDLANHGLTGLIWAGWHIPYWLGLLSQETMQRYTRLGMGLFVLLSVVGLVLNAILYGELRLVTGSVWPPLLLHTVYNAISLTLLLNGFVLFRSAQSELLLTPAVGGILITLALALVGLAIYRDRTARSGQSASLPHG
jgi:membrane protease YdiL (CAAX protease family)